MSTKTRRAFTLVRLNVLPSKLMKGRFQHMPISDCLYPCNDGQVETVGHVLLYCPFYRDLCTDLLRPIILRYPGRPDKFYIRLLLSDRDSLITCSAAKFCAAAMAQRSLIVS